MRILLVADAVSAHTRRWAQVWQERGHDVHIASFRSFTMKNIPVYLLPMGRFGKGGYLLALPKLRRLFRQLSPDIVHAQHLTSYGFLAAVAGLRPLVATAWGTDVLITPWRSRIYRKMTEFALRRADAITTVASHMNAQVVKLGVRPERIHTIPFGVDIDKFSFRSPRYGNHNERWRIICTRNLEPIYDVRTLIDAVALLLADNVECELVLVGSGSQLSQLKQQVINRGIEKYVHFAGYVEHEKLPALLARSDIFVTPAKSDGNNISLTEAMAVGCFPIATKIPANTQWLTADTTGLFAPGNAKDLANAIKTSIANPMLMQREIYLNRQKITENANWKTSIEKMERLFQKVVRSYRYWGNDGTEE